MRIAVVIESFDPRAGGNERSTAQILDELSRRGHDVTLITGAIKRNDEPEGIETIRLSKRKRSSAARLLRFSRWARQKLDEGRYDTSLSVTMAVPARVVQPRGGTIRETLNRNIALRGGGLPSLKKKIELAVNAKQQLLLRMERRTLADPTVHRVVALSGYVVRQLREHYDYPDDKIAVIPNAAVMPPVDDAQRAAWRAAIRRGFGVADGEVAYLFAAQNPALKGFKTLLHALAAVRERGVPAVVLLAGNFAYAEHKRVVEAGLRSAVRVIGQTAHMQELYAAADVTVLPTWYDPSSKVVLESLMMITPAISTAYNGGERLHPPRRRPATGARWSKTPATPRHWPTSCSASPTPASEPPVPRRATALSDTLSMKRHVDVLERVLRDAASTI